MNSDSKTVARRHAAAYDGRAIRAYDHAVMRPARSREIERARADMRLELSRSAEM
jgi:hypothetical protein